MPEQGFHSIFCRFLCKILTFAKTLLTKPDKNDILVKRSILSHAGVAQLVEQLICNPRNRNKTNVGIAGTRMNPTFFNFTPSAKRAKWYPRVSVNVENLTPNIYLKEIKIEL
ncbi:MAG: hypothetical protein E7569_14990 [Ruminococcaceae bacterium]|nr:hypothetical protein [Oscillospiraceae bacterium]